MKIQNALVSNVLDRSQRHFAHVTTVTLSWRVQNINVIGRVYFTLECFEFLSNFEFDRNMLSGTGAWTSCSVIWLTAAGTGRPMMGLGICSVSQTSLSMPGLAEMARTMTAILDDMEEMPLAVQSDKGTTKCMVSFQCLLKSRAIYFLSSENYIKCTLVECFQWTCRAWSTATWQPTGCSVSCTSCAPIIPPIRAPSAGRSEMWTWPMQSMSGNGCVHLNSCDPCRASATGDSRLEISLAASLPRDTQVTGPWRSFTWRLSETQVPGLTWWPMPLAISSRGPSMGKCCRRWRCQTALAISHLAKNGNTWSRRLGTRPA